MQSSLIVEQLPRGTPALSVSEGVAVVETIRDYDLSAVHQKLLESGVLSEELADEALEEYRKFMMLLRLGYRNLPMCSPEVDEVWHLHILFTRDYAEFCERIFGRFVHHEPALGHSLSDDEQIRAFYDAYKKQFGILPELWRKSGCNGSSQLTATATLCIPTVKLCVPT